MIGRPQSSHAGYNAIHRRVESRRGKASDYPCWSCWEDDVVAVASDWARVHGTNGLDPWSDYIPLCRKCHMRYDEHVYNRRRQAKLTDDSVVEIVRMRRSGIKRAAVASTFGISKEMVSAIMHGRHYSRLTGIRKIRPYPKPEVKK